MRRATVEHVVRRSKTYIRNDHERLEYWVGWIGMMIDQDEVLIDDLVSAMDIDPQFDKAVRAMAKAY